MSGFIAVQRSLWEHPIFEDGPMSEREAWIWMLTRAAWKSTKHRVGKMVVEVPRGSFMATLRELQKTFGWKSDTKIRNFLSTLEAERMIERKAVGKSNARKTQITICNYEQYQGSERTKNAGETHEKRGKNAVKEQGNKGTNISTSVDMYIGRFNELANREGFPSVAKITENRRAAWGRIEKKYTADEIEQVFANVAASEFLKGDTGWSGFSFDWMVKPANFIKILEGNYNGPSNRRTSATENPDGFVRYLQRQVASDIDGGGFGQAASDMGASGHRLALVHKRGD